VRTISSIGAIVLVLAGAPALAQVTGQPNLLDPRPAIANPRLAPAKQQPAPAAPPQAAPTKAQTAPPAKPPRAAAKPPSTPESRSAAALALSADPVFDEGTYQRIKEALLSYAAVQVRGGWPSLPADAKLAPGASGPNVALLRRRLVITEDLPAGQEASEDYDEAVAEGVRRFQVRHGLEATGSVSAQTLRALNVPVGARMKQLEASLERLLGMDFVFAER
jgi:murein L,D-transpeptidase YcbB/YkuD